MSLIKKLQKNTTIAQSALLKESKVWLPKQLITTDIPAINLALSGKFDGGMGPGILQIAGKSKRFKSKYALLLCDSFLKKFPDGAILFYDSEFGTPESYFDEMNVDNILHSPVQNIEALTIDIVQQFAEINKDGKDEDHLLVLLDSLGNVPSINELTNALEGKGVQDMTRAKAIKSLFRMIGPQIPVKNIYMVVINHTYDTIEKFSKEITGGGTGAEYNSNGIWIITAVQNKEEVEVSTGVTDDKGKEKVKKKTELVGFDFKIRIEKSRFLKQGTIIPITVSYEEGIDKWSGLLDLGIESGYITRPTLQTYALSSNPEDTYKKSEINDEFYNRLLKDTDFPLWIEKEYTL